ncbi:MAG TPA: NAD-binding protein, partial [Longimicrobiaceae bacterium]|nr:NAD-binding protein [Longimicrobiaceae bacterium]
GEIEKAHAGGLTAIHGNAHDDQVLTRADLEGRRSLLTITTNEEVNLLLARKAREEHRVPNAYVALFRGKPGAGVEQVRASGALLLFGRPVELHHWIRTLESGRATLEDWRYNGDQPVTFGSLGGQEEKEEAAAEDEGIIALTFKRAGSVRPTDDQARVSRGDVVTFACAGPAGRAEIERLRRSGWEPLDNRSPNASRA